MLANTRNSSEFLLIITLVTLKKEKFREFEKTNHYHLETLEFISIFNLQSSVSMLDDTLFLYSHGFVTRQWRVQKFVSDSEDAE